MPFFSFNFFNFNVSVCVFAALQRDLLDRQETYRSNEGQESLKSAPVYKVGTNSKYGYFRVPTRTRKPGKPGKMGRHFPVREKSKNFKQTGKVRENHTKYWKTQGI